MHAATPLLLLLCCSHNLVRAFPATLLGDQEMETDDTRQVLGSSVVTSVSVITDHGNGSQTIYTDSTGRPMAKPAESSNLASPPSLMSPDRYEFYTFNDAGDLVKRLMTLEEIQSLIAGESVEIGSDLPGLDPEEMDHVEERPPAFFFLPRPMEQSQDWSPPAVDKVVAKVQNVLAAMRNSTVENENEPSWSILPMNKIKESFSSTANPIPTELIPGSQVSDNQVTKVKLPTTNMPPKISTNATPPTTHTISSQYAESVNEAVKPMTTTEKINTKKPVSVTPTVPTTTTKIPISPVQTPLETLENPIEYIPIKNPTEAIPSKIPTDAIPSKPPTDAIPSKNPTDEFPGKRPTEIIPSKNPTDAIPSKPPTDAIPVKTTTQRPPIKKPVPTRIPVIQVTRPTPTTQTTILLSETSTEFEEYETNLITRPTIPTATYNKITTLIPSSPPKIKTTTETPYTTEYEITEPNEDVFDETTTIYPDLQNLDANNQFQVTDASTMKPNKPTTLRPVPSTASVMTRFPERTSTKTPATVFTPTNPPEQIWVYTSTAAPPHVESTTKKVVSPNIIPVKTTLATKMPVKTTTQSIAEFFTTEPGAFVTFTVPKFTTPSTTVKRPQTPSNVMPPQKKPSTNVQPTKMPETPMKPLVVTSPPSTLPPKSNTSIKQNLTALPTPIGDKKPMITATMSPSTNKLPEKPIEIGLTTNKIPSISSTTISSFSTTSKIEKISTTTTTQMPDTKSPVTIPPKENILKKNESTLTTLKVTTTIAPLKPTTVKSNVESTTAKIIDQTDNFNKVKPTIASESLINDNIALNSVDKPVKQNEGNSGVLNVPIFDDIMEVSTSKTAEVEITSDFTPTEESLSHVSIPTRISEPPTKLVPIKVVKPTVSMPSQPSELLDVLQEIISEVSSEDMDTYESTEDPNKPDLLSVPFISAISAENYESTEDTVEPISFELTTITNKKPTSSVVEDPEKMQQIVTKEPSSTTEVPLITQPPPTESTTEEVIMYININNGTFESIPIKIPSIIEAQARPTQKVETSTRPTTTIVTKLNFTSTATTVKKPTPIPNTTNNNNLSSKPPVSTTSNEIYEKITTLNPASTPSPTKQQGTIYTPPTFPSTSWSSNDNITKFEKVTTIMPSNSQNTEMQQISTKQPGTTMKPLIPLESNTSSESYEKLTTLVPMSQTQQITKVPILKPVKPIESSEESNSNENYEKLTTLMPTNNNKVQNQESNVMNKPLTLENLLQTSDESESNESYEKMTTIMPFNNKETMKPQSPTKPISSEKFNSTNNLEVLNAMKPEINVLMQQTSSVKPHVVKKPSASSEEDNSSEEKFQLVSSTEMSVKTTVNHVTAVKLQTVSKPVQTEEKINTTITAPSGMEMILQSTRPPLKVNENKTSSEEDSSEENGSFEYTTPTFPSETMPNTDMTSFESVLMEALKPVLNIDKDSPEDDSDEKMPLGVITLPLSLTQSSTKFTVPVTKAPENIMTTVPLQKPENKPLRTTTSTTRPEVTTKMAARSTTIASNLLTTKDKNASVQKVTVPTTKPVITNKNETKVTAKPEVYMTTPSIDSTAAAAANIIKNQLSFSSENAVDSSGSANGNKIPETAPDLEVSWQEPPEIIWTEKPKPKPTEAPVKLTTTTKTPEKVTTTTTLKPLTTKKPEKVTTTSTRKPETTTKVNIPVVVRTTTEASKIKPTTTENIIVDVKKNSTKFDTPVLNKTSDALLTNKNKPAEIIKPEVLKDKTPIMNKVNQTVTKNTTNITISPPMKNEARKPAPALERVKITSVSGEPSYTKSETTDEDMEFLSSSNPDFHKPSTPAVLSIKQESYYTPEVMLEPAPINNLGLEATTVALDEDIRRFIDLNNDLAIRMFKHVTSELDKRRSVALSPFGATSLLAMVFLGARGQTSAQMNDFLPLDDMITFNPHLVMRNITDSVIMSPDLQAAAIVRQLYSQESKGKLLDFYKARAGAFYDGLVQEVEFEEVSEVVRQRTNELVRTQTSERVPDFLSNTATLRLRAPLSALSANVFQMNCLLASTHGRNSELQFNGDRPGIYHTVPSAVWTGQFLVGYDTGLDATAVEIPHSASPGGALTSTVFVMPGRPGSRGGTPLLARLEARLISRRAWSGLLRNLVRAKSLVDIQLPRFEHRSVLNLTVPLRRMGLKDLFAPGVADLRGINGIQDLYLTDVMQVNAFSACSDSSAEGHVETYPTSRRTGRVGGRGGEDDEEEEERQWRGAQNLPLALRPRQARIPTTSDIPRLRLDRPFLYVVRHNPTGMILHMGRFNPRFNS